MLSSLLRRREHPSFSKTEGIMVQKKNERSGYSAIELLIVIALIGLFLLFTSNNWAGMQKQKDFEVFAQETLNLFEKCRWKALNERRYAGAVIENLNQDYFVSLYQDGNGNGIRRAEIQLGVDRRFYGPVKLTRAMEDIHVGILHPQIPEIPPKTGFIPNIADPVKFGSSDIVSFSPFGDSSSGTLYLGCQSQQQMYAIVLFGSTARLSLWKFSNQNWQMVGDR
jgi:prepilin-type N-terminal cleavage/methylation domain-containing protein